ncbi:MAG: hypothetical protein AMXMBFR84_26790 [Candidatus Hydrogenedentota bacterium]
MDAEPPPLNLDYESYHIELDSAPMPFVDWALVDPGHVSWTLPSGEPAPLSGLHGLDSPDEVTPVPVNEPSGIRIQVQAAEKQGRFLDLMPAEYPWEQGRVKAVTLAYDDDASCYRVWYECRGGLGYADSPDLRTWRKPPLNPTPFDDAKASNLAYIANSDECAASGMFQHPDSLQPAQAGSILIDPSAEPDRRFKTTVLASAIPDRLNEFARKTGKMLSSRVSPVSANVLFPAYSADGVAWHVVPEPCLLHDADTQTVVLFDRRTSSYVMYTRNWTLGRRTIGRSISQDYFDFPLPQTVLAPTAYEQPFVDFYVNAAAWYPSRRDLQLLFVLAYDRHIDSGAIRLATSRDGMFWEFTPGDPVVAPGSPSEWDSHFPISIPSLVRTPEGGLLFLYNGYNLPHKFPRTGFVEGDQGIAYWKADRLAALEAPDRGTFTTPRLRLRGERLIVNASTARSGSIEIEVLDERLAPVPGRTFAEFDALVGDNANFTATWKGESDLADWMDQFVHLRFRMRAAKIYAMRAE